MADVAFRSATPTDVDAIARLHADSWRGNYRGAYSDAFLDGDALADRLAVWGERLTESEPNHFTVVAELDGTLVGFIHTILDVDPTWGAVVQNLHVASDLNRRGIGSRLMAQAARALLERRPSSGLFVWVREDNTRAQAFYEARGGSLAGRTLGGPFADGGRAPVLRYAWPDPSTLLASG